MYTIAKQFSFSAAHHLDGLAPDHPCARQHGHNYVVEIVLASRQLNDVGFVVDYGDLRLLANHLDAKFDHQDLNEVFSFQLSAENLARYLFEWCAQRWPQTLEVRVSETPKTWASYSP